MAYEVVKIIKCIKNTNNKGEKVDLTVGKTYKQRGINTTKHSEYFKVFGDNGYLNMYDKKYFEILEFETRENEGFDIICLDCHTHMTVDEFKEGKCPFCGQIIQLLIKIQIFMNINLYLICSNIKKERYYE